MTTATSGPTSPTPFAYYDRASSSLRTSQTTFPWGSTSSSVALPRSGSMRSGECFERPMLGPVMAAHGCSSLLGTPNAHERTHTPRQVDHGVQLANQVASLLPTPRTSDTNGAGQHGDGGLDPRTAVSLLPTPTSAAGLGGNLSRSGARGDELLLPGLVKTFLPTPTSMDSAGSRNSTANRKPGSKANIGDTLTDAIWKQHGVPPWAKTNLSGASTAPPSTATHSQQDDAHPHLWTAEDGCPPDSWSG